MTGKNVRLPIERCLVAVFANQHLRTYGWRGQTAGDRSFGPELG
jgi:hypothetical protein